jgi:hypothetical protein
MNEKPKKYRRWKRRKLFTYAFKGRPARQLLWRKPVYAEWFEYAKLYRSSGGNIPRAFGAIEKFEFEEWWRHPQYGFELFAEPELPTPVELVDGKAKAGANEVLVKMNIAADKDILLRDIKKLIREIGNDTEYHSRAKFQPHIPMKAIKVEKLKEERETFLLTEKGLPGRMVHRRAIRRLFKIPNYAKIVVRREYGTYGKLIFDDYAMKDYRNWEKSMMRKVSHHRKQVREAFQRIEQGTF